MNCPASTRLFRPDALGIRSGKSLFEHAAKQLSPSAEPSMRALFRGTVANSAARVVADQRTALLLQIDQVGRVAAAIVR